MLIQALIKRNPAWHRQMVNAAVAVLNEALEADRKAVNLLFSHRVEVNTAELRDHPTIQVSGPGPDDEDFPVTMGVLGLINGLFGVDGRSWGYIYVLTKDGDCPPEDWIERFCVKPVEGDRQ